MKYCDQNNPGTGYRCVSKSGHEGDHWDGAQAFAHSTQQLATRTTPAPDGMRDMLAKVQKLREEREQNAAQWPEGSAERSAHEAAAGAYELVIGLFLEVPNG